MSLVRTEILAGVVQELEALGEVTHAAWAKIVLDNPRVSEPAWLPEWWSVLREDVGRAKEWSRGFDFGLTPSHRFLFHSVDGRLTTSQHIIRRNYESTLWSSGGRS